MRFSSQSISEDRAFFCLAVNNIPIIGKVHLEFQDVQHSSLNKGHFYFQVIEDISVQ